MNIVEQLRKELHKQQLDGLLITNPLNRRYVSGFTGTAGALLVTENDALLITDFRYIDQAEKQAPLFTVVRHEQQLLDEINKICHQLQIAHLGFEAEHLTVSEYHQLKNDLATALKPTKGIVEKLRLVKTKEEIAYIRTAANIVDEVFNEILTFIKPGVKELDIATEIEYKMRQKGASQASFTTIVASGVRSSLPHGVASEKKIQEGELVTLDFGAIYNGYCSDITRTVAVGNVSDELRNIYDIVLKAQERGVREIKQGMRANEADALVRDVITEHGYGENFGHSTGHGIGLDVHEGPVLSPRSQQLLQANMVVTVEPGIYLPHVGGCRIEDDIVITEHGNECLTQATKEFIQI